MKSGRVASPGLLLAALLPPLTLIAGAVSLWSRRGGSRRDALVGAGVSLGSALMLGTELLGLFHALRGPWVVAFWIVLLGAALALLRRDRLRGLLTVAAPGAVVSLLTAAALGVLIAAGLASALSPPGNWDALDYHLPRQVFWMQQGSLASFPASDARQLAFGPFAEIVGLHLQILARGDQLGNLVQWTALLLASVAASSVARNLGADGVGQALAALLLVTNPMAAHQSMNAKNDLVASFFVVALAVFATDPGRETVMTGAGARLAPSVAMGAALGLVCVTKAPALAFAAPVFVWGIVRAGRAPALLVRRTLLAGAVALALAAGFFARNLSLYGRPFGPSASKTWLVSNDVHTPAAIASNVLRNLGLHLGTPFPTWNRRVTAVVSASHDLLGIRLDDRRTTLAFSTPFVVRWAPLEEDVAGAPVHALLAIGAALALIVALARGRSAAMVFCILPFAGFVLFCTELKWQEWNARLHLPGVCLLAAVIGFLVSRGGRSKAATAVAVAAAALLVVAPTLLFNPFRPLAGPGNVFIASTTELRFRPVPARQVPAQELTARIAGLRPRSVGILFAAWRHQYLVERLILDALHPAPRFVVVAPSPMAVPFLPDPPDVIVAFRPTRLARYRGQPYRLDRQLGVYGLYVREPR